MNRFYSPFNDLLLKARVHCVERQCHIYLYHLLGGIICEAKTPCPFQCGRAVCIIKQNAQLLSNK